MSATSAFDLSDVIIPQPPKRVCKADGCGAVLSRYNHENFCNVHLQKKPKKRKAEEFCECGNKIGSSSTRKICTHCLADLRKLEVPA